MVSDSLSENSTTLCGALFEPTAKLKKITKFLNRFSLLLNLFYSSLRIPEKNCFLMIVWSSFECFSPLDFPSKRGIHKCKAGTTIQYSGYILHYGPMNNNFVLYV